MLPGWHTRLVFLGALRAPEARQQNHRQKWKRQNSCHSKARANALRIWAVTAKDTQAAPVCVHGQANGGLFAGDVQRRGFPASPHGLARLVQSLTAACLVAVYASCLTTTLWTSTLCLGSSHETTTLQCLHKKYWFSGPHIHSALYRVGWGAATGCVVTWLLPYDTPSWVGSPVVR